MNKRIKKKKGHYKCKFCGANTEYIPYRITDKGRLRKSRRICPNSWELTERNDVLGFYKREDHQ